MKIALAGTGAFGIKHLDGLQNIDGVTDQRFENATVVIDAQGNVDIQVKGYAVKTREEVVGELAAASQP